MARKIKRQVLTTLLATNSTLQAVYDHEVKDFRRISPVATVHSDGSQLMDRDGTMADAFLISLWWKRDSDGGETEDYLDDLSAEIFDLLFSQTDMILDDNFSNMGYPIVDGVMYRQERIRVIVL